MDRDPTGRKAASDRGNSIFTVEWTEDMLKRGHDGYKLLKTARSLIDKHTKALAA